MGASHGSGILASQNSFADQYTLEEKLGSGAFSTVRKCICKSTGNPFAVKIITKKYLSEHELIALKNEIVILKNLKHRSIIKLIDVFDDGKQVFMVLELCTGNDLFDRLLKNEDHTIGEHCTAKIVFHTAQCLQYLHLQGIVHRDLKPENILITKDGNLKISDFGLSHYASKMQENTSHITMSTCCGTPHYVAPEVINNQGYDERCDLWSLGVIMFICLVGYQPFYSKSIHQIYKSILSGDYSIESEPWDDISDDAKDLVQHLLCVDIDERYTSEQVLEHPWVQKHVHHYH